MTCNPSQALSEVLQNPHSLSPKKRYGTLSSIRHGLYRSACPADASPSHFQAVPLLQHVNHCMLYVSALLLLHGLGSLLDSLESTVIQQYAAVYFAVARHLTSPSLALPRQELVRFCIYTAQQFFDFLANHVVFFSEQDAVSTFTQLVNGMLGAFSGRLMMAYDSLSRRMKVKVELDT